MKRITKHKQPNIYATTVKACVNVTRESWPIARKPKKSGYVFMLERIGQLWNKNDFEKNLTTIVRKYKMYKVPRIMRRFAVSS